MANRKEFNDYIIEGEIAKIFVHRRNGDIFEVLVDSNKIPFLVEFNRRWHVDEIKKNKYYARYTQYLGIIEGKPKYKMPYLHHLLLSGNEFSRNNVCDHINHNTLDNRIENLRVITMGENDRNRAGANINNASGHRNISFYDNKYVVQIQINEKNVVVGRFDDIKDASRLAEKMRLIYYS